MKCAAISLAAVCLCLSGCQSDRPVESYGTEVITVHPTFEREVGIALVEAHRKMANWLQDDDGSKSDPTYKAGSSTWTSSKGLNEKPQKTCTRSYMAFTTADNQPVRIETIAPSDKPVIIVLEAADEDTRVRLHNLLVEDLQSRCSTK